MNELATLIERHSHADVTATPIPRLILVRAETISKPCPAIYYPLFGLMVRGRKRAWFGGKPYEYNASNYILNTLHTPVIAESVEAPYLGLVLMLDPNLLAEIALKILQAKSPRQDTPTIAISPVDDRLLESVLRLMRLLDQPEHIPVLAPLAERELLYWLFQGPQGAALKQLALPSSRIAQIGRAIECIRERYQETLPIDELAKLAGMSLPTFHRHFRTVTHLSPLQYQKRVQLEEARRLLIAENLDAATVAFEVGYESPSQFSREYRRMFGSPPGRDVAQVRNQLGALG